ncbi:MAG TPA: L,D-transpeptidase family protein [Candidatus Binataceae bacterium]
MRVKRVIKSFWRQAKTRRLIGACGVALLLGTFPITRALAWTEDDFENRPLIAYPMPAEHNDIIGQLESYTIQKGDTLLDVGRWYGLSAKEISDANGHIDWWRPPVGTQVVLPTEHILPSGERRGIILNIPEMRIYYYPVGGGARHKGKVVKAAYVGPSVVYSFPVGLGRFDWKTPAGKFTVRGKTRNPTWVVPNDIYQEHLERDGEAEHVVPGGRDDNPLGLYRLELTLPEYALHGTDVPWGVGMTVSHGCVRLYPEDIERLFNKVRVGTPGAFIYAPVKFGFRGDALYAEVHDDLYGRYPGLWNHATKEAKRLDLTDRIDDSKLEKAVAGKTGIPTYVGLGAEPDVALGTAQAPVSTSPAPIVANGSAGGGGAATAPEASTAPAVGASAEAAPGSVEGAGGAATAAEVPTAPAGEAPAGAEAAPESVGDAESAKPEASTAPGVEPPASAEGAPERLRDAGEAELGSSRSGDSIGGDKGPSVGSDEKGGAVKDTGGGLPTGVVEEPEGTQRTQPADSP